MALPPAETPQEVAPPWQAGAGWPSGMRGEVNRSLGPAAYAKLTTAGPECEGCPHKVASYPKLGTGTPGLGVTCRTRGGCLACPLGQGPLSRSYDSV